MRQILMAAAMAAGAVNGALAQGASGSEAIISSLFQGADRGCNDEVRVSLTDAIRAGIETEVRRAEASIENPIAIAAMGCLDQLDALQLDFAIQVPDLTGVFQGVVSSLADQACSMAADKLNEITAPLQEALTLPDFNAINIPGVSGGQTQTIDFGTITIAPGQGGSNAPIVNEGFDAGKGSLLRELYEQYYPRGR